MLAGGDGACGGEAAAFDIMRIGGWGWAFESHRTVAADLGKRVSTRELSEIGRVVAAAYRDAHGGKSPPQHDGFANGHVVKINSYFEKDRAMIVDAIQNM